MTSLQLSSPPEAGEAAATPSRWPAIHDGLVVGVGCWLAALSCTVEAFFTPFRAFGQLIPVSTLAAVLVTPLLVKVCFRLTRRGLAALPAGAWMLTAIFWLMPTRENDLVLASAPGAGAWPTYAFLLFGSISAGVAAYSVMMKALIPAP